MKISVTLLSILFALISSFVFASFISNSTNTAVLVNNNLSIVDRKILIKPKSDNIDAKTTPTKDQTAKNRSDVYNDGTSNEEIAQITKNIEYNFASSAIRPVYHSNLDKLAKLVIDDKYVLSLRGHADSVGTYKPNWMLSEKRAIKVKDYLISKGVDKTKIITIPFGSTVPIATNKTAAGRQKNRRVEIKLKSINE